MRIKKITSSGLGFRWVLELTYKDVCHYYTELTTAQYAKIIYWHCISFDLRVKGNKIIK